MRRRTLRRAWAVLAVTVVTGWVTACSSSVPDAEAQDKLIQEYIGAVQAGDRGRVAELAGSRVDASAEIEAKVQAVGGRPWKSVSISWLRGEFPTTATADITAVDDAGRPITDTVVLGKAEDEWFVSLGEAPAAGSPAATGSP
jgi:hypothetical protein